MTPLGELLAEQIRREGPIPFDRFMERALYDPEGGFFTGGGGAGRSESDFITSPEVGSLFGALVARALDRWWRDLDQPDPYVVVDAGAGRGQLARDVLRAVPECSPALHYVMVERSPVLRRRQREYLDVEPAEDALGPAVKLGDDDDDPEPVPGMGPVVTQLEEMPAMGFIGAVVANELLDNLPFRIVERRDDRWFEVRVGEDEGTFVEVSAPAPDAVADDADDLLPEAPEGIRLPVPVGVDRWFDECGRALRRGYVAVLDYAAPAAQIGARGIEWLRTYQGHDRSGSPLESPGSRDITADVPVEAVIAAARREGFEIVAETTQARWLRELGVDDLVARGRAGWEEGAHRADLEALKARSVVSEAEALLDERGLGAHRVLVLRR